MTNRVIHVVQIDRHGIAFREDITVGLGLQSKLFAGANGTLREHVETYSVEAPDPAVCTSALTITRIPMKVGTANVTESVSQRTLSCAGVRLAVVVVDVKSRARRSIRS